MQMRIRILIQHLNLKRIPLRIQIRNPFFWSYGVLPNLGKKILLSSCEKLLNAIQNSSWAPGRGENKFSVKLDWKPISFDKRSRPAQYISLGCIYLKGQFQEMLENIDISIQEGQRNELFCKRYKYIKNSLPICFLYNTHRQSYRYSLFVHVNHILSNWVGLKQYMGFLLLNSVI